MAVLQGVALSLDGHRVAYERKPAGRQDEHAAGALWLAPSDGSAPPRQFTAVTADDSRLARSPDGSQIAFLSDRAKPRTAQLDVLPAAGGEAQALTRVENKRPVLVFAWSPGGGHIAFASDDEPTRRR